jgi:hypothetical protein
MRDDPGVAGFGELLVVHWRGIGRLVLLDHRGQEISVEFFLKEVHATHGVAWHERDFHWCFPYAQGRR